MHPRDQYFLKPSGFLMQVITWTLLWRNTAWWFCALSESKYSLTRSVLDIHFLPPPFLQDLSQTLQLSWCYPCRLNLANTKMLILPQTFFQSTEHFIWPQIFFLIPRSCNNLVAFLSLISVSLTRFHQHWSRLTSCSMLRLLHLFPPPVSLKAASQRP